MTRSARKPARMFRCRNSAKIWLSVLVLSLLGMWPAILNGQPFFFEDTSAYIRGVDAGVTRLLNVGTIWSERLSQSRSWPPTELPSGEAGQQSGRRGQDLNSIAEKTVLAGRSVYYGAFLYLSEISGSLWFAVFVQSLLAASAVIATARNMKMQLSPVALSALALVFLFTPVPFFVSFLMPDVFAAFVILAAASIIAFGQRISRMEFALWWGLLTAGILFHSSHLVLAVALLLTVLLSWLASRCQQPAKPLIAIALSVGIGVAGDWAFSIVTEKVVGGAPVRPPFLTARIVADGPGRLYIREKCNGNFEVCRFGDHLTDSADAFLWQTDAEKGGVFSLADAETRRKLSGEQFRFALAVTTAYPAHQALATIRNIGEQIFSFGIMEFNYPAERLEWIASRLPELHLSTLVTSRAARGLMPTEITEVFTAASVLLSLVIVVVYFTVEPLRLPVIIVLSGIFYNAAICGSFSTPHDRYQARVIWLLPLIAVTCVFSRARSRAKASPRSQSIE